MFYRLFKEVETRRSITARYLRKQIGQFAAQINHNHLVVDVGGGQSPYKDYFNFDRYVSLDIAADRHADIVGDVDNLPFADEIADVVICTEVLEHVPYPQKALKEINRVLKHGGYLILSTPFFHGIHEESDFTRWTELGLKALIKGSGFNILSFERRGSIFSCMGTTAAMMPYQLFGPYKESWAKYPKYGLLFVSNVLFIPLARLFMFLDALDKRKAYTLGYALLARKA